MTSGERILVECFDSTGTEAAVVDDKVTESMSFTEKYLLRRKIRKTESEYIHTRFMLPQLILLSDFFSKACYYLGQRR